MAVTYLISVTIALFSGALPAQILGMLWEQIGESMSVDIPYIALLRLLGGAGAILAVILSERIRGYILARDLIVGAIALEAMCLIGFSMSREFWNLGVWITALGFSGGLCLSLICYLLRGTYSKKTSLLFISSALGIAAGVYIIRFMLSEGRSWRTACQTLAIIQIILCMCVFLLRRTILRDVAAILKKRQREAVILRQRRREKLIREKGEVDARSGDAYLIRLLFLYGAALSCGMLLLCAVHLTYLAMAAQQEACADLSLNILTVCGGMALGRLIIYLLNKNGRVVPVIGTAVTLACLIPCAVMAWCGYTPGIVPYIIMSGTGCGAGMIFPNLIQTEDERFDDEAQTAMAGLIPAFYLGACAIITPFVQSMRGASEMKICILTMTSLAACMGVCLVLAGIRVRRG